MVLIIRLFLVSMLCGLTKTVLGQLQIVPQTNAQQLAQKLVGSGVTISNVSLTGSALSTAFFYNQANTQLSIDSGIVLSTGRVQTSGNLYGLNGLQSQTASSQMSTPGDAQLSALVAPRPTNDAVVLEFDFIPVGDSVKFRYVFSSDEYPTFTCSNFNDVFAFFINGPGIAGTKNIALVPGTDIPVAINSINSGTPGGGYNIGTCNSMGPGSPFTQFFVNNTGNQFFTHNGHTVVLTAAAAVQPCQTYHLKIAIADVQDRSYDSGVFLEAGSLKSEPLQIIPFTPLVNGQPYLVEGCTPGGIKIVRARKSPYPQPVNLVFGGNAINGTDVQLISSVAVIPAFDSLVFVPITPVVDNMPEGMEVLKIYVSNGCIFSNMYLDSIQIQIRDYDTLALSPWGTAGICRNSSLQIIANTGFDTYHWSPDVFISNTALFNPVVSPDSATTYICTAVLGDCHARDSVKVEVKTVELLARKNVNCLNGNTGQIRVSGGAEWKAPVQFNINNSSFGPDSVFSNLPVGNYIVRMRDAFGCMDSILVNLTQEFPDLLVSDSVRSASCSGINGSLLLSGSGGKLPYTYAVDAAGFTSNSLFNVNSGNHTIHIKDSNGCITSRPVIVGMDSAIHFTTTTSAASCSGSPDGTIYIHATGGSGHYQYSINGTSFQPADSFLVTVGSLDVTVKDDKGCTSTHSVFVPLNQSVFIDAGADTTICEGSSVQLNTVANAVQFSWTPAGSLSGNHLANPIASPVVTTTYYVSATKDICTATDSVTVFVRPAPVPLAGPDSSVCVGGTYQLHGSGGSSYAWFPASAVSNAAIADPMVRPVLTTSYYLKVTDDHQCVSLVFDTVIIHVVPAVQVFAGRDTSIAKGQSLQMNGIELSNSGATIYQWSPVQGLNDPFIVNPVALAAHDITYTLKMTTPGGCEGTDQVTIKVFNSPNIYVPSGFTPNGDGRNDRLMVIPVGMKELKYFRVFNRWGQPVFSTVTESMGWDGRINGKDQPAGTYVWLAEAMDYKGQHVVRRGTVTLIR